jgi:quercetin dioxygenase-like cupin family protein
MDVKHFFSNGLYCKETKFLAGEWGEKHTHDFDHLSVLCCGKVELQIDGVSTYLEGPQVLTITAEKVHRVIAITDVTWLCCHATECTDPEEVDNVLIEVARA